MSDDQQPMWGMAVIVEGDRWQFRPRIPRAVWDAMVERMLCELVNQMGSPPLDTQIGEIVDSLTALLRAALGNPEVEP